MLVNDEECYDASDPKNFEVRIDLDFIKKGHGNYHLSKRDVGNRIQGYKRPLIENLTRPTISEG